MAANFPNNPTNGQTVTIGGVTYSFSNTNGTWTSSFTTGSLDNYLEVANSAVFVAKADAVASNNAIKVLIDDRLQVANLQPQLDKYLQVANSTSFASTSSLDAYLQVANANFITQSTLDGYLQVANSTSFATTGSLDAYLQVANSTSFASTSSLDAYLQVANSTGFASSTDLDAYLQVANAISLTSFDVLTSTPSGNGSLVYNSSNGSFTFTPADATQGGGGGGGGASVTASDTAPASPSAGDLWFHTTQLKLYVYYSDGSSNQWIQTNSGVGNRVDEFIKAYRYQGTLAINTGDTRLYLQDSYILKGIHAYVDTAPTGSSVITDVKKNGSSLQTITVAAGATTASNTSLSHTFVSGDYLTVDITQVGSSTAGTNLYMVFTFN